MSLYNMVFGADTRAPIVLALLDKEPSYFGRLRDAWIEKTADGQLRLAVYTRNGGGNRAHHGDKQHAGSLCDCTGCIITHRLPANPLYLSDCDDAFDSTYATVYFRVPADAAEKLKALGAPADFTIDEIASPPLDTSERWRVALEGLKSQAPDEAEPAPAKR